MNDPTSAMLKSGVRRLLWKCYFSSAYFANTVLVIFAICFDQAKLFLSAGVMPTFSVSSHSAYHGNVCQIRSDGPHIVWLSHCYSGQQDS